MTPEATPRPWTLTARWIFPVTGPPLEGGTVTVAGGRIVSVDVRGARRPDMDFGDAAVLPGLVNAHTHLDLSGLRGQAPPGADFTQWLRSVIRHRLQRSPEQVQKDIRQGIEESLAHGTTLVGDISAQGASWELLADGNFRGRAVVFYELLGLPKPRAHQAWAQACSWLRDHPATATCRPGLSPHAPYSVRRSLFRAAGNLAGRHRLLLATHLAETRDELQLLAEHRGPFVGFLKELAVWSPEGLAASVTDILEMSSGAAGSLCVHANYLDPVAPIPENATIIYCPRTHAAFGHGLHPVEQLLQRGVRVALGTDSLASNPDLDLLAEARYLHQLMPQISGAVLLRMATLSGAEALGWAAETGSLSLGKSADLVVMPLPQAPSHDPYDLLWHSSALTRHVLVGGAWSWPPDARVPP